MISKDNERALIRARKLQKIILNKSKFSDWIKRIIEKNRLKEKQDYFIKCVYTNFSKNVEKSKLEYFFTEEATRRILLSQRRKKLPERIEKRISRK